MTPVPQVVVERVQETADTVTLVLAPPPGRSPAIAAGQFNMLWAFGVGEVPISVSALGASGEVAHTVRSIGPVSAALAGTEPGDLVGVRGPFGVGWDVEAALGHDLVIVAGGIGLAPLRPVLRRVVADREAFGNVALLVGARSPESLLYPEELAAARDHDVQVEITVDHAPSGWTGDVGIVTVLVARAEVDPSVARAMVCGPELMMRRTVSALLERGIAADAIEVSIERNMQCAIGTCGHCQIGPVFACRNGPVLPWLRVEPLLEVRER